MRSLFASSVTAAWTGVGMLAGVLLTPHAPACADDAFAGLTPMTSGALGGVAIQGNIFTSTTTSNRSNQVGNVVGADHGGKVINGAIENNAIANNRGITTVMMNTGNNVAFNSATTVNIILPAGGR
jgi:hypothetical protein